MFVESQLLLSGWYIWLVPGMLITVSVVMTLQIWHLGFSNFLLSVDVAVYGKFDFSKMFP